MNAITISIQIVAAVLFIIIGMAVEEFRSSGYEPAPIRDRRVLTGEESYERE